MLCISMLLDRFTTSFFLFYFFSSLFVRAVFSLFFFNDTAPTEIYTLSLHDALPISLLGGASPVSFRPRRLQPASLSLSKQRDRKSTRLNSSHMSISYAVFCLKKKKNTYRANRM